MSQDQDLSNTVETTWIIVRVKWENKQISSLPQRKRKCEIFRISKNDCDELDDMKFVYRNRLTKHKEGKMYAMM